MKPYLLQGHERPITTIQYNYDGDLLYTASKDLIPSVWRTDTGERLGTFIGHKGTIWDIDVDRFTTRLLTGSADSTVRVWDCQTGQSLLTYPHRGPVRGVSWNDGCTQFATICDPFIEHNAKISIFNCPSIQQLRSSTNPSGIDYESITSTPVIEIDLPKINGKRINPTNIKWTLMNLSIIVTFDNGMIKLYNPNDNMNIINEIQAHDKKINRLRLNRNKSLFITSSIDFTSKLYDPVTLQHIKTYKTDRPVNDACISEKKDHILLGGGQEAMSVTTTAGKVGKFETRFFHLIYQEEFGTVKGHFGPINALDISPTGRSYASGAEDGYVRLHVFDQDYLDMKDPVPEEDDHDDDDDDDNNNDEVVDDEDNKDNNNNVDNEEPALLVVTPEVTKQ